MSDAGRGDLAVSSDDADLMAIRQLIALNDDPTDDAPPEDRSDPPKALRQRPTEAHSAPARCAPAPAPMEAGKTERQTGQIAELLTRLPGSIKAYRPRARIVIATSMLLLLLLYPVAVIGWAVVAAIFLLALYLIVGEDRFWLGAVSLHGRYARINPAGGRRLRVRARLAARRWDRWVAYLPDRLADTLRSPDVRALVLAERRHDAVLTDRLNRLGREQDQRQAVLHGRD
jgi:hypothetical protein